LKLAKASRKSTGQVIGQLQVLPPLLARGIEQQAV